MIYGFYFRFYKITHNVIISTILSYVARMLMLCKFWIKRLFLKKRIVQMDSFEAINVINKVYPDPHQRPNYDGMETNPDLDLSIIVPVYNCVETIEETIRPILNQKTKYTYEVILIDDGSSDGTHDIVLKYKERANVKVVLQENLGTASARNAGIDCAEGKYLMFVDGDDIVHDNIVEMLMDRAITEDCDIVMMAHNLVKERNGQIVDVIPNVYTSYNLCGYKNRDAIMNYAGLPWGKVYKRELFREVRFFPGYWYEDTIVQFLLFTQCKRFAYIPEIGYEYRWHEKNLSHTVEKSINSKVIDRYWVLLAIIEQYERIGLPLDAKFYTLLIRHLSAYFYRSIALLNEEIIDALFVMVNVLLVKYRPQVSYKLPYILKITERAILTKDINLWKLASMYQ